MSLKLNPEEAATCIREDYKNTPIKLSPVEQHIHAFVKKVCAYLGIEPDAANAPHVLSLLKKKGIEPHEFESLPKMHTREATRADVNSGKARFVGEVIPVTDEKGDPVVDEAKEKEHSSPARGRRHK